MIYNMLPAKRPNSDTFKAVNEGIEKSNISLLVSVRRVLVFYSVSIKLLFVHAFQQ